MAISFFFLFFASAAYFPATLTISSSNDLLEASDPKWSVRLESSQVGKDFEDGRLNPWFDTSAGTFHWRVENLTAPLEANYPVPTRPGNNGTKHARVERSQSASAGELAVLRSPEFVAHPGDQLSFSFWIRSRHPRGNTLQVTMSVNNTAEMIKDVSVYSNSVNFEWNTETVLIPVNEPTNIVLLFYGYCGSNPEDAIAIDDILVVGTRTSVGSTTTTPRTETTTTSIPFDCVSDGDYPKPPPYCGPEFYRCGNGVGILRTCSNGTFFDSTRTSCVPPTESQCYKDFSCPPGSPDGFLPLYPEACTIYYFTCFNGGTYPQTCSEKAVFNPAACLCAAAVLCTPAQSSDVCNPTISLS